MPFMTLLADVTAGTDSVGGVFEMLKSIFTFITTNMGTAVDTITDNPLLFVPVIIGFAGGMIMLSVSLIRRLGVGGGRSRKRYSR